MPRLIFVNRFFFPDHSATSQILSDLAFDLAHRGRDVHVVTSRQNYDDPQAGLPAHQIIEGVRVYRLASTRFGRGTLPGRAVDYASFYRSVRQHLAELARPGDIVVAKTDPPLLSVAAMGPVRRNGAHLVNWLQDVYPETAAVLGVPLMKGAIASGLTALRNRALRQAVATIVVGERMAARVESLGAPAARVHVIANWCNDDEIRPVAQQQNPLRRQWGLEGKFVLGYSGNLGRAHDYETVLTAAERLRGDARFVFLMIGGGKGFEELAAKVKTLGLDASFRFLPYQERSLLTYSLGAPDAHWLSLHPQLDDLLLPSKFYGIAAAGKPMIFVGGGDGELARLIRRHDCGIAVAPGDVATLIDILQRWSREPRLIADMGKRARAMLDVNFRRQQSLERWHYLLEHLIKSRL